MTLLTKYYEAWTRWAGIKASSQVFMFILRSHLSLESLASTLISGSWLPNILQAYPQQVTIIHSICAQYTTYTPTLIQRIQIDCPHSRPLHLKPQPNGLSASLLTHFPGLQGPSMSIMLSSSEKPQSHSTCTHSTVRDNTAREAVQLPLLQFPLASSSLHRLYCVLISYWHSPLWVPYLIICLIRVQQDSDPFCSVRFNLLPLLSVPIQKFPHAYLLTNQ